MRVIMELHTPNENPDWTRVAHDQANVWQRLALATRGVITPGNLLSVAGVVIVAWGALLLGGDSWILGLLLVGLGRLADIADGVAASYTQTKSRLGEAVDTTCDKLTVAIIVFVAFADHIVQPWFLAVIAAYNLYLICFAVLKGRRYRLHPSRYAKLAMFTSWLAILCMVIDAKRPLTSLSLAATLLAALYTLLAVLALYTYHRDLTAAVQERRALTEWPGEVTDLICVVNQRASNFTKAHHILTTLSKEMGLKAQELDIAAHETVLAEYLKKHPKNRVVLMTIAGGDGSVSAVVNTMQRLQSEYPANQYFILPLWGGNANDLSFMLNGLRSGTSVKRLLTESSAVPIPLIRISLQESKKQERVTYACCYASFGASAYAARQLDMYRFSTNKLISWLPPFLILRELIFVLKAIVEAPLYLIEIEREEKTFYEHTIINGSRIAKVNRVPITLDQPEFFHALVTRKEPSVIISLARILLGKPDTVYANRTELQFTTKTRVDAQIDGEVLSFPAHTRIAAEIVQPELRFISTKLRISA